MELSIDLKRHAYGGLDALQDIQLDVKSGEIICVIGPSGCGKSTLLGIIGGLIRPTDGTIRLRGAAPDGCLNELTYIFQDFALLPWRTVYDNVSLVFEHHGLRRDETARRVEDVLARTGLLQYRSFFPKQLSGGMRQRVGIARALAVRPAVLLMDEPFSALDAQTRELLIDDFLQLWAREKLTAIYITHNLEEAIRTADRILVLCRRPGRIKDFIDVPIPQSMRQQPGNRVKLSEIEHHIWSMIRQEAIIANEEVADA